MRTGATFRSRARGVAAVAVAGSAALTAACASGGGGPRPVVGAEAEALSAELSGVWVLDESGSSAPTGMGPAPRSSGSGSFTIIKGPGGQSRIVGDVPSGIAAPKARPATFAVLLRRPEILTLRVDSAQLVYMPLSGRNIHVPMGGEWTSQTEGESEVRTRVVWDEGRLGLEHEVDASGWVTEVLEVVNGRLRMTREIHRAGESPPIVLVYDRDAGEG